MQEEVTQNAEVVTQNAEVVTQNAEVVTQNAETTPYYIDNNSIKNNNIKENNNSCSSCYKDAPDGAQPQPQQEDFLKKGNNLPAEALRSTTNEDIHRRIIAQQHAQREQAEKDYEAHREEKEAARDAFFRCLRAGELLS